MLDMHSSTGKTVLHRPLHNVDVPRRGKNNGVSPLILHVYVPHQPLPLTLHPPKSNMFLVLNSSSNSHISPSNSPLHHGPRLLQPATQLAPPLRLLDFKMQLDQIFCARQIRIRDFVCCSCGCSCFVGFCCCGGSGGSSSSSRRRSGIRARGYEGECSCWILFLALH